MKQIKYKILKVIKDTANITKRGMANNSTVRYKYLLWPIGKWGKKGKTEKVDKMECEQRYMYWIGLN